MTQFPKNTPPAPRAHWRTDHAMYCLYQIQLSVCVCLSVYHHLSCFCLRFLLSSPSFAVFFWLSYFRLEGTMLHVYVCVCLCVCLHKVSSCVTLRCWEATGSPTAVGIRTGQVTACERPSFYLFALSVSSSLAHTHTLNRANRSVGLADRRCVSGVPTASSLHFPFIWRTFTCLSNAFTQFSDQPVSRLI